MGFDGSRSPAHDSHRRGRKSPARLLGATRSRSPHARRPANAQAPTASAHRAHAHRRRGHGESRRSHQPCHPSLRRFTIHAAIRCPQSIAFRRTFFATETSSPPSSAASHPPKRLKYMDPKLRHRFPNFSSSPSRTGSPSEGNPTPTQPSWLATPACDYPTKPLLPRLPQPRSSSPSTSITTRTIRNPRRLVNSAIAIDEQLALTTIPQGNAHRNHASLRCRKRKNRRRHPPLFS